jgi:hypothetical protein
MTMVASLQRRLGPTEWVVKESESDPARQAPMPSIEERHAGGHRRPDARIEGVTRGCGSKPQFDGTPNVAARTPMQSRSRAANGQPINDHQAKRNDALNRTLCVDRRLKGADYEQRSFHSIEHLGRAVDVAMPTR